MQCRDFHHELPILICRNLLGAVFFENMIQFVVKVGEFNIDEQSLKNYTFKTEKFIRDTAKALHLRERPFPLDNDQQSWYLGVYVCDTGSVQVYILFGEPTPEIISKIESHTWWCGAVLTPKIERFHHQPSPKKIVVPIDPCSQLELSIKRTKIHVPDGKLDYLCNSHGTPEFYFTDAGLFFYRGKPVFQIKNGSAMYAFVKTLYDALPTEDAVDCKILQKACLNASRNKTSSTTPDKYWMQMRDEIRTKAGKNGEIVTKMMRSTPTNAAKKGFILQPFD